ncbi:MAG TPA: nuclear transport factor 2 family protein [Steroidobacteraceae bacterium]|nr:nuclear transport factor 2 family protein [Steroidobacteraceae bacterium]
MSTRTVSMVAGALMLCAMAGFASAQALSADQQEIWKVEHQQWKMAADKDLNWIDKLLHPNMQFWETGAPMPRDFASIKHWGRYEVESGTTLEYEIFPISVTITGNVAVAQYHFMLARENYKKDRETVTGHYMDVLIKEGGRWQFIAWAGGDDPKK